MWRIIGFFVSIAASSASAEQYPTNAAFEDHSLGFEQPFGSNFDLNEYLELDQIGTFQRHDLEEILDLRRLEGVEFSYEARREIVSRSVNDYETYNDLMMMLRNPRDGMEGGQAPVPAVAPLIQASISSLPTMAVDSFEGLADSPCNRLSQQNLDDCFLPVVGLISLDPGGGLKATCSGTILGPHHVLAAAHCVCKQPASILLGTGLFRTEGLYRPSALDKNVHLPTVANARVASALISVVAVEMFDEELFNRTFCSLGDEADTSDFEESDLAILVTGNIIPFPRRMRAAWVRAPAQNTPFNIAGFGPDPSGQLQASGIKRYLSAYMGDRQGAMQAVSGPTGESCRGDSGSGAYLRLDAGTLGVFAILSSGRGKCPTHLPARYVSLDGERLSWLKETVPELEEVWFPNLAVDPDLCLGWRCNVQLPRN